MAALGGAALSFVGGERANASRERMAAEANAAQLELFPTDVVN